jgi:hypothetical protein
MFSARQTAEMTRVMDQWKASKKGLCGEEGNGGAKDRSTSQRDSGSCDEDDQV